MKYETPALTIQKLLARLKFQRGGQNVRMTNRTKTICPSIFDLGGMKICPVLSLLEFNHSYNGQGTYYFYPRSTINLLMISNNIGHATSVSHTVRNVSKLPENGLSRFLMKEKSIHFLIKLQHLRTY